MSLLADGRRWTTTINNAFPPRLHTKWVAAPFNQQLTVTASNGLHLYLCRFAKNNISSFPVSNMSRKRIPFCVCEFVKSFTHVFLYPRDIHPLIVYLGVCPVILSGTAALMEYSLLFNRVSVASHRPPATASDVNKGIPRKYPYIPYFPLLRGTYLVPRFLYCYAPVADYS